MWMFFLPIPHPVIVHLLCSKVIFSLSFHSMGWICSLNRIGFLKVISAMSPLNVEFSCFHVGCCVVLRIRMTKYHKKFCMIITTTIFLSRVFCVFVLFDLSCNPAITLSFFGDLLNDILRHKETSEIDYAFCWKFDDWSVLGIDAVGSCEGLSFTDENGSTHGFPSPWGLFEQQLMWELSDLCGIDSNVII